MPAAVVEYSRVARECKEFGPSMQISPWGEGVGGEGRCANEGKERIGSRMPWPQFVQMTFGWRVGNREPSPPAPSPQVGRGVQNGL